MILSSSSFCAAPMNLYKKQEGIKVFNGHTANIQKHLSKVSQLAAGKEA